MLNSNWKRLVVLKVDKKAHFQCDHDVEEFRWRKREKIVRERERQRDGERDRVRESKRE